MLKIAVVTGTSKFGASNDWKAGVSDAAGSFTARAT